MDRRSRTALLGEWPATNDPPHADSADKGAFRRAATEAVADVWADAADDRLRRVQRGSDRYTSAEFWQQRPELHALIETGLGLLRSLATATERVEERRDHERPRHNGHRRKPSGTVALLERDARRYPEPLFWQDRHLARAALSSTLTLMRVLVGRLNRAAAEAARGPASARRPAASPTRDVDA